MAVYRSSAQNHHKYCQDVLSENPSDALNYLTFTPSSFDGNRALAGHYYRLSNIEKKSLKTFFTDAQKSKTNRTHTFNYTMDASSSKGRVRSHECCNLRVINDLNKGRKKLIDVEKVTMKLLSQVTNVEDAFRLLDNLDQVQSGWIAPAAFNKCITRCLAIHSSRKAAFDDAQKIIKIMQEKNIKPDIITAMNFLTACAECGQYEAAKQLLFGVDGNESWLSRWGLKPDTALFSLYLTVCAKTGHFKEAYELVDIDNHNNMQKLWFNVKPPITFDIITAMDFLMACAECGQYEAAEQLLFGVDGNESWLSRWGVKPDTPLYNVYLMVCAKTGHFKEACELIDIDSHNNLWLNAKPPITYDIITAMNFLTACAECGQYEAAKQLLFDVGSEKSWLSRWGLTPNIALFGLYLTVCAKTGHFKEAYELVDIENTNSIQKRWPNAQPPIKFNCITAMIFLMACVECGEFDAAKQLLFGVKGKPSWLSLWGETPNTALYNVYLTVCAKTGHFKEAYELVDIDNHNNMQKLCLNAKPPITFDIITATNFLMACAECGQYEAAEQLLFGVDGNESWLSRWGVKPATPLYNIYLTVCARKGHFKEAYELVDIDSLNNMQKRGPNAQPPITFNIVTAMNFLTACAECGEFDAAKQLLFDVDGNESWLSRWGVTPNTALFSLYLTVCAKTGHFKEAYELVDVDSLNNVLKRWLNAQPPITFDIITAMNLLTVCAECGNFEAAEQILFDVDGNKSWLSRWGLKPNIAISNAYLMVCAKSKRLDAARDLINKFMPTWGLKPDSVTYSHLAIIDLSQFEQILKDGLQSGIYRPSLGLINMRLDFHINKIFKLDSSHCSVPLTFAKALFRYHYIKEPSKIKKIITGYHLGQKLRDEFSQFLLSEFSLRSSVDADNLGVINIE